MVSFGTFVPELLAYFFAGKLPVDVYALTIGLFVPDRCFLLQQSDVWDSSSAEALPGKENDLTFRLIEPPTVFRGVVDGETVPKCGAFLFFEIVRQRFGAMDVEVIHDQMYGVSVRVAVDDRFQSLRQLRRGAISTSIFRF